MSAEILRDLNLAKVAFQLRTLELILGIPAQVDTRPQGGDAKQAPFTGSAVLKGCAKDVSGGAA